MYIYFIRPTHGNAHQWLGLELFRKGFFRRLTAGVTAFFFTFVFYINPASLAIADEVGKEAQQQAAIEAVLENTPEKKLSHRLAKLYEKVVQELPQTIGQREAQQNWLEKTYNSIFSDGPVTPAELTELKILSTAIETAYQSVIGDFEQEAKIFENEAAAAGKALSPEVKLLIKERHTQALTQLKARYTHTQTLLNKLLVATSADEQTRALDKLGEVLEKEKSKPGHTPATPDQLPWGTSDGEVREPVETQQDLHAAAGINPLAGHVQLAMGDSDSGLLVLAEALAVTNANILNAELGESIDVQITPEIKALALSLHNNSTEIYAWVHNNIRFIPSYGSIQGAQYTLEAKQGNAIDTASLLIALLRASNIPARYAYGTVDMPIDQMMNWVGGVSSPQAAQDLLSQGGIPNTLIKINGQLTSFRMEHVWVEAWVNYLPGRGTKANQGDTWIPMDASFKQHEFTQGMNLKESVPFDAQVLVNSIQTKATVNATEGWVQNVPQADIEAQLTDFQNKLKAHIENQNPTATVGEVLGLQKIKILPPRPLAAGLPYKRIVTSSTFAEVPDKLRHKFKYSLAENRDGVAGSPGIYIEKPTVTLAGKTLAVSFTPASKADEDIIASRLPAPEADGNIDPAKLPKTLPGYLIKLVAQFTVNGETLAQTAIGNMGGELREELGLWSPKDAWQGSTNKPTAGEYRAIGLDLQGVNPEQAMRLKASLEGTKAKLESREAAQLATLSKHNLVGDLLYGTVFNYFALNDLQDKIAAQASGIISYRLPSYGTFSTSLTTQYWYGIPRNVAFGGLSMDIDRMTTQRVSKNNNAQEAVAFTQSIGARMSAMEHLVPEQMFSTTENKAEGISAVKALAIASQQGQKIWTITEDNLELALSKITIDSDAKADIFNAVNAGKVVTAHEAKINFDGWIGEGYVIVDPLTGAGGYIIAGGGNGAFSKLKDLLLKAQFMVGSMMSLNTSSFLTKALFQSVGQIVSVIFNAYNFLTKCSSLSNALALTLVFTLISAAIMLMLFFLAGPLALIASIGLGVLESKLADYVISKGC
ncbi:MAG: transglutaminase-like domain-containing protein [Pseudomonadota bacterium]